MSAITQCPQCNTRFKVSQEQLDAHQGLVRCGRCQVVFNATHYLYDDEPSPQLDLPILLAETQPKPVPAESTPQDDLALVKHGELNSGQIPLYETPYVADHATLQQVTLDSAEKQDKIEKEAEANIQTGNNIERLTLAQQIAFAEKPLKTASKPVKKIRRWPWVMGCLLLLVVLLAQATYFFRVKLAANLPGLKPALTLYCDLFLCAIPLPHDIDQMSIESSDMEIADPAQANIITFNALLRNHAPYPQAYPNLELTLTDTQDKALARRVFRPAEYLKAGEDEKQGVPANRETSVKLHLDTTDLKPTGFRLFLFYPQ